MANVNLSMAARNAANDAVLALIDNGASAGRIRIYSGTMPASPDVAPTGSNILLAELVFQDPAFPASSGGSANASTPIASVTAAGTGTASWFRCRDSDGAAVLDGTVGTTTAFALQVNTTSFVAGVNVSINSLSISSPMSC